MEAVQRSFPLPTSDAPSFARRISYGRNMFVPTTFILKCPFRVLCRRCQPSIIRSGVNNFSTIDSEEYESDEDVEELLEEQSKDKSNYFKNFHDERNVYIIQPRSKWGPQKTETMSRTSFKLQLEEAVSLVKTLKNWKIVDQKIINSSNINQPYFFGPGKLEEIARTIAENPSIDTVFLSVNKMHGWQQYHLEETFGVEVFDRFSVVLQIFNDHARTKEAKLQVALAEIPYIRSRLRQMTNSKKDRASGTIGQCGSGETYFQLRQRILDEREMKLKRALEKMNKLRDRLRSRRQSMKIPTVSVVGYTNSGKTSLIKSLTDDASLEPKNELFATLDVTVHSGRVGSMNQVLFVDTVGFICDIPSTLIQAFNATLREVTFSDLVVHVHDVSNPDLKNQRLTVDRTLNDELKIGSKLDSTMIHVGNKVDKLAKDSLAPTGCDVLTSATDGTNIALLREEIEKRLLMNTACFQCGVRIETGSNQYFWLQQNCNIFSHEVDQTDENFIIMSIGFNEATFGRFKKLFGPKYFVNESKSTSIAQRYLI